jgi:hypothetical protein
LVDSAHVRWQDRAHFFAISSQLMRRILVDAARARGSAKRWGAGGRASLDDGMIAEKGRSRELIALDEALDGLAKFDERKAKVVEMQFFGDFRSDSQAASTFGSGFSHSDSDLAFTGVNPLAVLRRIARSRVFARP